MPEIKTGNRKDDTQPPFKICSGKCFFLAYLSHLRQDKLPVFVFRSLFCFKTVICTGFKMAALQHRLSKNWRWVISSISRCHSNRDMTLQRITNKRDLLNYMESEFRITCTTFYAAITVRQIFFISITVSYRQPCIRGLRSVGILCSLTGWLVRINRDLNCTAAKAQ